MSNKALSEDDWKKGIHHWRESAVSFEDFSPKLAFLPLELSNQVQ